MSNPPIQRNKRENN